SWSRKFLGILIAGLWMAVGYYIFEVFIIRIIDWRANIPNLFANIAQAFVGAVIFLPLSKPLERLKDI
ncbi:MAG: ECF transporter S component, partial [Clostridiales bacterium]|nr:ECF transporter S component [Clostridiales bacterium]NLX69940.1 ECF transporter S component [Clostridiales bacterium]